MTKIQLAHVDATVYSEREYLDEVVPLRDPRPKGPIVRTPPGRTGFRIVLSAVLDDSRRITENGCLSVHGTSKMRLSEIREHLDTGLGRDPTLHSPTPLGWSRLVHALIEAGLTVAEADLIDAPLEISLSPVAEQTLTVD